MGRLFISGFNRCQVKVLFIRQCTDNKAEKLCYELGAAALIGFLN